MEVIGSLLFGLVWELLAQLLAEGIALLLGKSAANALGLNNQRNPLWAIPGALLIGAGFGLLSVLTLPGRVIADPPLPGLSIVLAPPIIGLAMEAVGRWFDRHERARPPLTTFWGAAVFSLGMALTRFMLLN